MKIAICDDEPIFLEHIKKFICNYEKTHDIVYYTDSKALLNAIINKDIYDIYFLDIEMPDTDGLKLADLINKRQKNAIIIFLTSHEKYVYSSFKVNAFRYIRKCFIEYEIIEAIDSAIERLKANKSGNRTYIHMKNGISENISYNDIIYVRKFGKNIEIHLFNKRVITERKNISQFHKEAVSNVFLFCDKGTLVNIENILKIEKDKIIMVNEDCLFISRLKTKEFNNKVLEYWGDRM